MDGNCDTDSAEKNAPWSSGSRGFSDVVANRQIGSPFSNVTPVFQPQASFYVEYGLCKRRTVLRFQAGVNIFVSYKSTESAWDQFYSVGTRGCFLGSKTAGA
jgi:hypothetical protein